jgi:hypothetical protein
MRRYLSIEEEVDADFARARRRAFLRRISARWRGDTSPAALLPFEEIREALGASGRVRLGRMAVPVERIVGSVGRHRDFDRDFLPAKAALEERWKRVDRAFNLGKELPPVALHKVGGAYFVEDGNHRVSVARYQGVGWIDAEVVELRGPTNAARRGAACPECFDEAA